MANPIFEGSKSTTLLTTKDIDILSENIHIFIDKKFEFAEYTIDYQIYSENTINDLKLLFYAIDFNDSFQIIFNEKPISYSLNEFNNEGFDLDKILKKEHQYSVRVYWDEHHYDDIKIEEFKFFKVNIHKGINKIRIKYIAKSWQNNTDFIPIKQFKYSLSPAKYWKSFHDLTIEIENEDKSLKFETNLGKPLESCQEKLKSNIWNFKKIPSDYIEITEIKQINLVAKILLFITPEYLSIILGFILLFIHVYFIKKGARRKLIYWLGLIFIPFIICCGPLIFSLIISLFLESNYNFFYSILYILFYPVVLLVYFIILFLLNKYWFKSSIKTLQTF